MSRHACPCEQDVLDALAARRWPHRCDGELRQHVAACGVCRDLVDVASALLEERDAAGPAPDLPPASLVWWRSQLRAREEAARAAARPLRFSVRVAAACAIALALLAAAAAAPALRSVLADVRIWTLGIDANAARDTAIAVLASRGVQLAVAAWLVLGPVAIYLALADD
jgi:hypothetical protein